MTSWYGVLLPARSPQAIVAKLNTAILNALSAPDAIEHMKRQGLDPVGSTPEVFAAHVRNEVAKWARVVKDANIKAD